VAGYVPDMAAKLNAISRQIAAPTARVTLIVVTFHQTHGITFPAAERHRQYPVVSNCDPELLRVLVFWVESSHESEIEEREISVIFSGDIVTVFLL